MVRLVPGTILLVMLFIATGSCLSPARGEEAIKVEREKDKTVYTIGSEKDKDGLSDRERSWEMLNNMNVITREGYTRDQHGKGPDHNR